jgi:hypothetical protein
MALFNGDGLKIILVGFRRFDDRYASNGKAESNIVSGPNSRKPGLCIMAIPGTGGIRWPGCSMRMAVKNIEIGPYGYPVSIHN